MKKIVSLCCAAALVFTACEKEKENPAPANPTNPTKTELLTEKNWKIVRYGLDINGDGQIDPGLDADPDSCEFDDRMIFHTSGLVDIKYGTDLCDELEVDHSPQWTFINNETGIVFSYNPPDTAIITSLTGTKLVLKVYGELREYKNN